MTNRTNIRVSTDVLLTLFGDGDRRIVAVQMVDSQMLQFTLEGNDVPAAPFSHVVVTRVTDTLDPFAINTHGLSIRLEASKP